MFKKPIKRAASAALLAVFATAATAQDYRPRTPQEIEADRQMGNRAMDMFEKFGGMLFNQIERDRRQDLEEERLQRRYPQPYAQPNNCMGYPQVMVPDANGNWVNMGPAMVCR